MKLIAITYPHFFTNEADIITKLLEDGKFWRIHIRKPDATACEIRNLIERIPAEYYSQITVHDHFELAEEYNLGGIHLNSRNPMPLHGWNGIVSRSIHTLDEIRQVKEDYAFLSPIFPSISKPGHKAEFDIERLRNSLNTKIFALGGVTPEKLSHLEQWGFSGAAMLGSVWKAEIDNTAFMFQFITHQTPTLSTEDGAKYALEGGCRWIQLRHKYAEKEQLVNEGKVIRRMCSACGATFIIDDHVELVERIDADGVHLGKNDMPVADARKILGPAKIIGATANTFEDIVNVWQSGADYIGLGPFGFTTTKKNLSPVLGIEGYRTILDRCRKAGIDIPIVAIGGITDGDIHDIMSTGVSGIALSSFILNAENPVYQTEKIAMIIESSKRNVE